MAQNSANKCLGPKKEGATISTEIPEDKHGIPGQLRYEYERAGQEHVFQYVDRGLVSDGDVALFVDQLRSIDLQNVEAIFEKAMKVSAGKSHSAELEPLDSFAGLDTSETDREQWWNKGLEAIGKGEVALVVLSGGQGSRLGFSGPKGMYNIGLPSQKTLFEYHGAKLKRILHLAQKKGFLNASVPWYVMTSPLNNGACQNFFKEKSFFGLPPSDISFFVQGLLPCMTDSGKFIMESTAKIATSPDGNGGIYPAMKRCGVLDDMRSRGVKYIHAYAVDNIMCKVVDPSFLGYCISKGADCGNKVVWKEEPNEKVGVVAKKGGKSCVVEYSEMTVEQKELRDSNSRLVFGAGNICNHFYTLEFLRDVVVPNLGSGVVYHVARKEIPCAIETEIGQVVTMKPGGINGIKLETFIFDIFPLCRNMAVIEIAREDEFAPIKNPPGSPVDSPDSARILISDLCKRFLKEAGILLQGEIGDAIIEIDPCLTFKGEGVDELLKNNVLHLKAGEKYLVSQGGIFPDASPPLVQTKLSASEKERPGHCTISSHQGKEDRSRL